MLQRLSWDSLQQQRAHNRVWMLYRIRNGLVAIPPDHLKQTTVATRRQNPLHANPMQHLYVQPDVLPKHIPTMEPRTFRHLLPRT